MIRERLEEARRNLLDLTRRNRLLNFRPEARRVVRIADELPSQVFRLLVEEGKTMQFLPLEEAKALRDRAGREEEGGAILTELFDLAPVEDGDALDPRHTDLYLQTAHQAQALQSRLLAISRESESVLQERGCNVLYLTLGTVHWSEPDRGSETSIAPLLLLPVELVRRSVRHRHAVRLLDEDPVVNPILAEFLRRRYRVELPGLDADAQNPVQNFYEKLRPVVDALDGFRLDELQMFIGLLSFAKLLMYLDLDPDRWPADRSVGTHPLVLAMTELASPYPAPGEPLDPATLDDAVSPEETYQVLDADSSQQAAILAAKHGRSMVIQGPPGTGKSQTITNIIAECLAEGKSVLFVAEKGAALEVVKRRLESVGLGSFVAELHSRKASKRAFMEDLAASLEHGPRAGGGGLEVDAEELARLRGELNGYVRALHDPAEPLGASPYEMIGRCAALSDAPEAVFWMEGVGEWTEDRLRDALNALTTLSRAASRVGPPATHPFRGVGLDAVHLTVRQGLLPALADAGAKLGALEAAGAAVGAALGARGPRSLRELRRLEEVGELVLGAPALEAQLLEGWEWESVPGEVAEIIETGRRVTALRGELGGRWAESAEEEDWADLARRHAHARENPLRLLQPAWWRDRGTIRRHLKPGVRLEPERLQGELERLAELRAARAQIEQVDAQARRHFGPLWNGDRSDFESIDAAARALAGVRRLVNARVATAESVGVLAEAGAHERVRRSLEAARGAREAFAGAWSGVVELLSLEERAFLDDVPEETAFEHWRGRLEACSAGHETLRDWIDRRNAVAACRERGLSPFLDALRREQAAPEEWSRAFERQFCRLWLDGVMEDRPVLRRFRGEDHEAVLERFRELDERWLEMSRARLAAEVVRRRPRVGHAVSAASGLGMLEAEIRKKRRIKPIRRLLASAAGEAVQRIKPCFMMSPLSLAQYLEPGRLRFDVVIFDEASQVEPADALGAVARGDQLILVGDDKQLPPTNFFDATIDEEAQEDDSYTPAGDLESVLALGQSKLPRSRLRWHYRSRHESLIEFSNREFYEGSLRVFPSPSRDRQELGLAARYVPDAVYLRGGGRYNPVEARRVAEAVLEHARTRPELSLGVGAFSVQQQRAIEDEVERLRREAGDPVLEGWFEDEREEPFFVKNLETIQGDERDVMLLSVGYGPDESGRMTNNFGPVNRDGGWRRLNVLVTRARLRCRVFSSITAEQIDIDSTAPRGVQALKSYLQFAASGGTTGPVASERESGGGYERHVQRELEARGWEIRRGVGCEGFTIDLAVVDPGDPDRYLAGIECDGPTYRACATARDRDRLREAVLEGLGWRLVRAWSTDWYHQPRTTIEHLHERLCTLREAGHSGADGDAGARAGDGAGGEAEMRVAGAGSLPVAEPKPDPGAAGEEARELGEAVGAGEAAPPGMVAYERFDTTPRGDREDLLETPVEALAELIGEIVRVEGPIHQEEVIRIATDAYGCRATGHAADHAREALATAITENLVTPRRAFIWPAGMDRPPVRWRGTSDAVTAADLICEEEVVEAIVWAVEHDFGVPLDDLPAAAVRALGFRRVGSQLLALARRAAETALAAGRIRVGESGVVERVG